MQRLRPASLTPVLFVLMLMAVACQPLSAPAPQTTSPAATGSAPTGAAAPAAPAVQPSTPPTPAAQPDAATPRATSTVNPATFRLELTPVARGLQQPVFVTHAGDGSGVLYVVEKTGSIRALAHGSVQQPFLDIRALVRSQESERGLLGLAFHPDYRTNRYFYVNYTNQQGHTVVARYTATPDGSAADRASARQVLLIEQPFANHNGGGLVFGPDGKLWIGTGDGGSGGDPRDNAQNRGQLLGKMLRIDVDSGDPYGIPADNPFAGQPGVRPEIWAVGLRNPWRYSFDRATGDLYIADVGQNSWEEVNVTRAGSRGGENYGWNRMEATHCYPSGTNCDRSGLVLPIHEYATRVAGNCSVTGGYVYRGRAYPALTGAYLYGDYCSGRIWVLAQQADGSWSNTEMLDTSLQISSFGEDEDGELYVTAMDGGVYRVTTVPKQARTAGGNCALCHIPAQQHTGGLLLAALRRLPEHP